MLALSSVALYSDPTGGEAPLLEELQPLRYLPASPPPPAASAAGQLLAAHPVAASASALGALLAIGAACSYVTLSRRLAKLSELDEAAEALDPEYF